MKLQILENVKLNIKPTNGTTKFFPFYLTVSKNQILNVDKIESVGKGIVNLILDDGQTLINVPNEIFSVE
jgi:hypothetical protein